MIFFFEKLSSSLPLPNNFSLKVTAAKAETNFLESGVFSRDTLYGQKLAGKMLGSNIKPDL